jgi:glutamine amidotransferase
LANVRSATAGQAVQLSNCQPFRYGRILGIHNGYIENFRQTLYRPIRDRLNDACYQLIEGTTDSEHVFALICHALQTTSNITLEKAVYQTLLTLVEWAQAQSIILSLNLLVSDGHCLVATRFAYPAEPPSLYWLRDDPAFASAALIASEPLFASDRWTRCPANSIVVVGEDLDIQTYPL